MSDVTLLGDVEEAGRAYKEAREALDVAREALYAVILTAVSEGIPAARVGRSAGLSRERVRQLAEERREGGSSGATSR